MPRVLLALGSNLGDRAKILDAAVLAIVGLPAMQVLRFSSWHATQPVGGPRGQGEFLNGALLVDTELVPNELRRELEQIERRSGRERAERWAARGLDLDILLYDKLVIDRPELQVPHPRMSFRPFVLAPAAEIAAEMVHPALGVSVGALWQHLQTAEDLVVICGDVADNRRRMMEDLLCHFPPHSVSEYKKIPAAQEPPCLALRIGDGQLSAERFASFDVQPKLKILLEVTPLEVTFPNPKLQLFSGIPTLTLDPRIDSNQIRTEAVAALEAVWPDLCQ